MVTSYMLDFDMVNGKVTYILVSQKFCKEVTCKVIHTVTVNVQQTLVSVYETLIYLHTVILI